MSRAAQVPQVTFAHVAGVSWPRSGHHLLVRLLTGYFGPAFVYCEHHVGRPTDPSIPACCRQSPCAHADRVVFTKNHDFALAMPQLPGKRYLVQYRDFAPSVVSNFELAVREGLEDTPESFRRFASERFTPYLDFLSKWVTSDFAQGEAVLPLPYEDLVSAPVEQLDRAVRHIAPGHVPDPARLRAVVARVDAQRVADRKIEVLQNAGVHASRDVTAFRFYDRPLFGLLGALTLRRQEVAQTFQDLLGRPPAEHNMLAFQAYETREALAAFIRSTPEYRNRQVSPAPPAEQSPTPRKFTRKRHNDRLGCSQT